MVPNQSRVAVVCIEVKKADKWNSKWNRRLRSLKDTGKVDVIKQIGVYTGKDILTIDDVHVLPVEIFLQKLFSNKLED